MTNAVNAALAERQAVNQPDAPPRTPARLITNNKAEFTSVLPSHMQGAPGEAWLRLTLGALKTGKLSNDGTGRYELEIAAMNNPVVFMQACRKAASMGLQPGTEQFYFTMVRNRDNGNRQEILGITGYKGYIELMYRGGHVASVIVETVHEGEQFEFVPGRDIMPMHQVDWMTRRGKLKLVYAYAKMHSGAVSKVVILNEFDIEDIKSKSSSFKFNPKNSPWTTDERAMWLKSGVRRLQTWVPWSIEIHGVGGVPILPAPVLSAGPADAVNPVQIQASSGSAQITDGVAKLQDHNPDQVVVEAELVEPPAEEAEPEPAGEPAMEERQRRRMMALFTEKGFKNTKDRHDFVNLVFPDITVESSAKLTREQARQVIDALEKLDAGATGEAAADVPSDVPAGS